MQANAIRVEAIKKQQRERRQKIAKTDALIKAARKRYCLRRSKAQSTSIEYTEHIIDCWRVLFTLIYIYIYILLSKEGFSV